MSALTIIYTSAAAIAAVFGLLHLSIWLRDRSQTTFLLASIMSFGAGIIAWLELSMALASSPDAYHRAVFLSIFPVCAIVVPMVWFIRLRLDAGRSWLAILISAMWIGGMLIELLTPGPFMVSSVAISNRVSSWGEVYSAGVLTSPWIKSILLDLPTPLMAAFVADASVQAFRRGERREAIVFGGSTFLFIILAGVHAALVDIGAVETPYMISIAFVAIAVALGFGLVDDVVRSAVSASGLELQRRRWRALLDGLQLAAIRTDKDGRITYINDFLGKLVARPTTDIVGKHLVDLVPPERQDELGAVLDHAKTNMLAPRNTGAVITAKNEVREIVWFNVRLTDATGAFDGIVSLGEDVTEAVRTRDELVRTRRDMERLSRILTLGELTATLAHELSQPIGAVLSNVQAAEMLRKQSGKAPDEIDEILEDILHDARRATGIMNRVRGFAFNDTPVADWFDLRSAVDEVKDILSIDAGSKRVKIVLDGPDNPVFLRASRIEVQQVLMNLALNSIQALAGSDNLNKQLWIKWHKKDANIEICVDDNGPGLPYQSASEVFTPFSSTKSTGTGIGLAVSRRIVERHRGTIATSQSPAGGARFRVILPIGQEEHRVAAR